ncbi:site-2 protease family protein [Glycomyces tarimensis]
MKATLRLGQIAGIRVGLHWSVLGVVVLLVLIVSSGMGAAYPGHSALVYIGAGVLAAALFMLSLLIHEIAHAIVARRHGVQVDDITLWLLGGVAQLKGDAPTPGADFRIAVIGPLASLLTAAAFTALTWLSGIFGIGEPWTPVLGYLAVVNVILAVFNLIPAAPLDGGRVLRAALWHLRGDRTQAAVWSARVGRAFGLFLLLIGVFGFFFGYGAGLWWVLLGLFIVVIASAEERQAQLGDALEGLRVRDVMTQDPDTAPGEANVEEFLHQTAMLRRHSAFPLLDEAGRLQGLITLNRMKAVAPEQRATTRLRDVACPPDEIPLARPDEHLNDLLRRMSESPDGRALVFSEGYLVGIVSPSDISRAVSLRGLGVDFTGRDAEAGPRLA